MIFLSACPSACQSVCQTRALWQNGKICPDFYTMRKTIQSSFLRRRMVGGGDPFYLKFWVNRPRLNEIADFEHNAKKVQLTLIGSPLRAFQRAQEDHRTLSLSPPKGGQNAKRPFFLYNRTSLEESLLQSFLCENCQRQSCRAFIGLTIHAKVICVGDVPFYLKFWVKMTALESEIDLFSFVAPQPYDSFQASTTRFPMSPRWTSYVVSKPPKSGWKAQNVQNLNNKLR